jgi:hypothetical protein
MTFGIENLSLYEIFAWKILGKQTDGLKRRRKQKPFCNYANAPTNCKAFTHSEDTTLNGASALRHLQLAASADEDSGLPESDAIDWYIQAPFRMILLLPLSG